MVNAISVEKLSHLTEAACPPYTIVFHHLIPVVGGEAPVLSVSRERIGWGTCLSVEVEIFRFHPCLYAVTGDTDGDITFQDDMMLTGILVGGMHLLVEVILYEEPELYILVYLQGFHRRVFGPFREHRSLVFVTVVTESGIGHQPLLVLFVEGLIGSTALDGCPFLLK